MTEHMTDTKGNLTQSESYTAYLLDHFNEWESMGLWPRQESTLESRLEAAYKLLAGVFSFSRGGILWWHQNQLEVMAGSDVSDLLGDMEFAHFTEWDQGQRTVQQPEMGNFAYLNQTNPNQTNPNQTVLNQQQCEFFSKSVQRPEDYSDTQIDNIDNIDIDATQILYTQIDTETGPELWGSLRLERIGVLLGVLWWVRPVALGPLLDLERQLLERFKPALAWWLESQHFLQKFNEQHQKVESLLALGIHAERQNRRQLRQLSALHALGLDVVAQHDSQQLLQQTLELAQELLDTEIGGYFAVVSGPLGWPSLELKIKVGEYNLEVGQRFRADGPLRKMLEQGRSLSIPKAMHTEGLEQLGGPYHSLLFAPLKVKSEVVGVLCLGYRLESMEFTDTDLELLERFAALAAVALSNAHLLEELGQAEKKIRARAELLEGLGQLSQVLSSELELDRLYDAMVEQAVDLFKADVGALYLYQASFQQASFQQASSEQTKTQQLERVGQVGTSMAQSLTLPHTLRYGLDTSGKAYYGNPNNLMWQQAWLMDRPLERSSMMVSLGSPQQPLGILLLGDSVGTQDFTGDDLEAFERYAALAKVALENARLYTLARRAEADSRRRAELLEALTEMSRELSGELELEKLYDSILERVATLFEADQAILYLREPRGEINPEINPARIKKVNYNYTLVRQLGKDAAQNIRMGEGLLGEMLLTGQDCVLGDYQVWASRYHKKTVAPYRSFMLVTLGPREKPLGVLMVADTLYLERFAQDDLELLGRFASIATVALENARLYTQEQQRLRFERLRSHISSSVTPSRSSKEFCERLLEEIRQAYHYEHIAIYSLEEGMLHCQAVIGYQAPFLQMSLDFGINGRVARTGISVLSTRAFEDPDWKKSDPDLDQIVCVPIRVANKILGTLCVESNLERPLGSSDLEQLSQIAESVSFAFENARLYESLKRRSAELERAIQEAEYAATHDVLTRLPNRRAFERDVREVIEYSKAEDRPFVLAVVDLAGFKAINDRIGHTAGDHALQRIAHVLAAVCPKAYRVGGDEFHMILEMPSTRAYSLAQYVVERVEALEFDKGLRISPNIGLAEYPSETDNLDALQTLADHRMYSAKKLGRPLLGMGAD
jgi:diguanylate cyclase (GGDEF)-like protein